MPSAVVQMNVRLPSQVKEAGDTALAEAGVTPTEFVRAVWAKLAMGGSERQEVEVAVLGKHSSSAQGCPSKAEALANMRKLYVDSMERWGIEDTPAQAPESGNDALDDRSSYVHAMLERMDERGTL